MPNRNFSNFILQEATKAITEVLQKELTRGVSDIFKQVGGMDDIPRKSPRDVLGGDDRIVLNITINNNAGATVTATETTGPFDEKYLEITIDQMVANSLARGRQTSGVMQSIFGIVPGLMGR